MSDPLRCLVVSDFNGANLASYLNADAAAPALATEVVMAPSVGSAVNGSATAVAGVQAVIIWMQPERVARAFATAIEGGPPGGPSLHEDVDAFASAVLEIGTRVPSVIVASWVLPGYERAFGTSALRHGIGVSNLLLQMNARLADRLGGARNIHLLDAGRWMLAAGANAYNPRLWYAAKIPFSNDVFREAARDVKAALRAVAGDTRKLVIVDLDGTLWGGLVGESGWQSLRLGGHDPMGEAYLDFQRGLKALANRGILLAIASKNDEGTALEVFEKHPEMILRRDDFAAWRINWADKAQNVVELLASLNLGARAAVFIDDHPAERARVGEALPEVLVPEWPRSPLLYRSALLGLDCFDTVALTDEDRVRTALYQAEQARAAARADIGSFESWLSALEMRVDVAELNDVNGPRATQLLNKTNQMNLSTRRLAAGEFLDWAGRPGHRVWTFRVSDRFGDAGLTGLLSIRIENDAARIVDFVVSCRVLGRRVEETMLHYAIEHARTCGVKKVVARFEPTPRNGPCKEFLTRSGLANGDGRTFWWDASLPYAAPQHVQIEGAAVL